MGMNGMNNGVKVQKIVEIMDLYNFLPDLDLKKHRIMTSDVNRPALQLSGFFEHFEQSRVQIIGNVEYTYLQHLDAFRKREIYTEFMSYDIPCIIFCRDCSLMSCFCILQRRIIFRYLARSAVLRNSWQS